MKHSQQLSLHVVSPARRIEKLAEMPFVQPNGHRVDREVPAAKVRLDRVRAHQWQVGWLQVGLAARRCQVDMNCVGRMSPSATRLRQELPCGRAKPLVRNDFPAMGRGQRVRQADCVALNDEVKILRCAPEQYVSGQSAYREDCETKTACGVRGPAQDLNNLWRNLLLESHNVFRGHAMILTYGIVYNLLRAITRRTVPAVHH